MPSLEVNHVYYNYELLGDKENPAVVFISGYTSDLNEWRGYAEKLQNQFYMLIFDNQGVGKTVDNDRLSLTIDIMARNTKALINELDIKNPVIVGFAMGSTIAQTIAHIYPGFVKKLILFSSVLQWSSRAKEICKQLHFFRQKNKFQAYAEMIYDTCFDEAYKHTHSKEVMVSHFIHNLPTSQTVTGQRRQLETFDTFNSSLWINTIKISIVIISPESDMFAPPEMGKELAMRTHGKYIMIPHSGHAVLSEKPGEVIKILQEHCC